MNSFAVGPMAYNRAHHGASDQSVPATAMAKSAIGRAQIGRFSDCSKDLTSRDGAVVTRNAVAKIATSDVDQGSETAGRMAKMSAAAAHAAGSRHRLHNSAPMDSPATALTIC